MKNLLLRGSSAAVVIASIALLSSCVAPEGDYGSGYGYDSGVGVGIGLDYYEPYGAFYGGWGPGYHVAPYYRGHEERRDYSHPAPRTYRPAPASHSMPSIPSHARSGGSRQRRG
ncbi:MAG: hypothetical protein WA190_17595 [Usitatibacter sp.]